MCISIKKNGKNILRGDLDTCCDTNDENVYGRTY